ncbi:flagellar filament capping protein FliD [Paenibacillus sp. SC116]|uniref:flagellar filament capping protein FliD n=1 Tax=Paenibacillus sp. SC116 TaxID=2968986 RepID=UPI00215A7F2B|nr:flagellar filament capping protein FliD [Paenibacillus sp. SC116]MCR8844806.1 flagellar filament capping protein FliD [Paenibacillus sp. SC116]
MPAIGGPIRISGMSSGMDIDKLVSDLMRTERLPLDKLHRQKQELVWKREDYRSMNTTLLSLRNSVNDLRLESGFAKTKVTSSNTNLADVISNNAAATSAVVDVKSLATGAITFGDSVAYDTTKPIASGGTFTIEGKNGKETITVTANVSSVKSIVDSVNAKSSTTGVKAYFDENTKRFMFSSTEMGSKATVTVGGDAAVLTNVLNIKAGSTKGTDATYTINGSTAVISSSSNTVDVNGIMVALKGTGTLTLATNTDKDGAQEKIKEFVAKYNELVDKLSEATTTRPNRNFEPLTDSEKEALTDKQIEQWEKKARQGTLYSDDFLESTLTQLRTMIRTPLEGVKDGHVKLLSDIGIKQSSDYKMNGKLEIDEAKLSEALNTKFDQVVTLFTKPSTTEGKTPTGAATRRAEQGFAERIYEEATKRIDSVSKKIGSSASLESMDESWFGKELRNLSREESRVNDRLIDIENRYYKKFTAMEKALQSLNNKGNWLSQQLGAM